MKQEGYNSVHVLYWTMCTCDYRTIFYEGEVLYKTTIEYVVYFIINFYFIQQLNCAVFEHLMTKQLALYNDQKNGTGIQGGS